MTISNKMPDGPAVAEIAQGKASSAKLDRMSVGTLRYTRSSLLLLFFWLLWGDFCFQLMECVMPKLMPLQLESSGATMSLIGALVISVPAGMGLFLNPMISVRSDRYRGRLGRRIPFLLLLTPLVALFLILLGFSPEIGGTVQTVVQGYLPVMSPTTALLATMGVLMICFQFFNIMMSPIYSYLFNDVVPPAFLGRFAGLNNMVSLGAAALFNYFLFGLHKTYMREIYLGAALLYLVVFWLMCWQVKEGQYPPPPPRAGTPGISATLVSFFRESFTHRFYLYVFLSQAFISMATGAGFATVFFFTKTLNMGDNEYGHLQAWMMIFGAALAYPFGVLADRIHPVRLNIIALPVLIGATLLQFLFIHDITSAWIVTLIADVLGRAYWCSRIPMWMRVFPRERYGQFAAAQGMLMAISTMIAGSSAGWFLDIMGDKRHVFVWTAFWFCLSLIFTTLMYREWSRLGGAKSYTPPQV